MNGFISKTVMAVSLTCGLAMSGGCNCYRNLVDPCYPERYEFAARQEVCQAFVPQVNNGHVLDQTIWNFHFEAGTDKLTQGAMDHLAYLARRRPSPDPTIYLQTSQEAVYDPANPDKFVEARNSLDEQRIQAIHKYLTAQTANRPVPFEVVVHDPSEVGMSAIPANNAIQARNQTALSVPTKVMQTAPERFPGSAGTGGLLQGGGGGR